VAQATHVTPYPSIPSLHPLSPVRLLFPLFPLCFLTAFVSDMTAQIEPRSTAVLDPEEEAEFAELEAFFTEGNDEQEATAQPLPLAVSDWFWSSTAFLGVGYDDNPLQSSRPVASAFVQPEWEIFGSWTPGSRVSGTLFAYLQTRQFERTEIEAEYTATVYATGEAHTTEWVWRLTGDLLYARQIYDATRLPSAPTRTSGLTTQTLPRIAFSGQRSLTNTWRIEPYLSAARSWFEEIDEDYWAFRGELRVASGAPQDSRIEFFIGAEHERYLYSLARTERGVRLTETPLRINSLIAGGRGALVWGTDKDWSLALNAWVAYEDDDQGDYNERWRFHLSPELRWRSGRWDLSTRITLRHIDYVARLSSSLSSAQEEWHQRLAISIHGSYDWNEHWSTQVNLALADLDTNRAMIAYRQRSITGICSYHF